MKKKFIIALSILILSGVSVWLGGWYYLNHNKTITQSGLIEAKGIDDLIIDSDIIIQGKVNNILPGKWTNPERKNNIRNTIVTHTVVDISKVYKGVPYDKKSIQVRVLKGSVDELKVVSDGYADFKKNEEVVLFLSKDKSDSATDENYYLVTGMRQGKFILKKGTVYESDRDSIDIASLNNIVSKTLKEEKEHPRLKMSKEEVKKINEKSLGAETSPNAANGAKDEPVLEDKPATGTSDSTEIDKTLKDK